MEIDVNKYLYRTIKVMYEKLSKSLFELSSSADIRKWMRTYFTGTVQQHLALRNAARQKVKIVKDYWIHVADREFMRLFHRKMQPGDYRVSCIGRNEFSDTVKAILRKICFSENLHNHIAYAHNQMLPSRLRN